MPDVRAPASCAAAVAAVGGLVPTPVGVGPRFHPSAQPPPAGQTCRPSALAAGHRVHLELFAHRRVVIVPTAIGLAGPTLRLGRVVSARCRAPIWTLDPSGVVHFDLQATLGDLFATWGRALGPRRLASFRGAVSLFLNGRRRQGDPRRLRLRDGDEIVLEVGGHVPPHRSYRFPP